MYVIIFLLVFPTHTIYNVTSYRFRVSSHLSVKCFIDTGTENNLYVLLLLSITPESSTVSLHSSALTSFCEFFLHHSHAKVCTHTHAPVGGKEGEGTWLSRRLSEAATAARVTVATPVSLHLLKCQYYADAARVTAMCLLHVNLMLCIIPHKTLCNSLCSFTN